MGRFGLDFRSNGKSLGNGAGALMEKAMKKKLRVIHAKKTGRDIHDQFRDDPYMRLAAGVVIRAIRDFQSRDILKSLDALLFLVDPFSGASIWLDIIGMTITPIKIISTLCGDKCGQYKNNRRVA